MVIKKKYRYSIPESIREFISEFLGTFLQYYLLLTSLMFPFVVPNTVTRLYTDPNFKNITDLQIGKRVGDIPYLIKFDAVYMLIISFVWAGGLLGGLMLSVPVSGGYMNPAISVTLATMSRLEWRKLCHYIPAQYLGAFFAALCFHGRDDIILYVLTSTPHPKINMWTAMADSFFASAIFSFFLFAILDTRRDGVIKYAQPLLIAFTLFGIVLGFYADSKVQLSPGHDFGTRLYAALVIGFEKAFGYCFWWLPKQVCLYAGTLAGGWFYVILFGPENKVSENKELNKSQNNSNEEKNIDKNQTKGQNLNQKSNPENQ